MAAPPAQPPPRLQLEQTLEQLLQTMLELGICASDIQESALESSPTGVASGAPGGLIGRKVTQSIEHLQRLHSQRDLGGNVMIPLEVINLVDGGKNPHLHTKNFIERLSGENMYTNGMLSAVSDYRTLLNAQLAEAFPDLADYLPPSTTSSAVAVVPHPHQQNGNGATNGAAMALEGDVKMQEVR